MRCKIAIWCVMLEIFEKVRQNAAKAVEESIERWRIGVSKRRRKSYGPYGVELDYAVSAT